MCTPIPRTRITRSRWRRAACWWTAVPSRGAGEQGFFERTSGLLSLRRVNVEQVLSWQEDRLYFRAEPLASIARSLERQFNVDITIPDERLRRICFTGEFVDGENIHEIMRIISADSRILCRSRKNHFELYRNR